MARFLIIGEIRACLQSAHHHIFEAFLEVMSNLTGIGAQQGPAGLKVRSHPVVFDRMSPATSTASSVVWDVDDEVPTAASSSLPEPGSPWDTTPAPAFRDSTDQTAFNYAPDARAAPALSRFAPAPGSADAVPAAGQLDDESGSKQRTVWAVIMLEAVLLVSIVVGFLALQSAKSRFHTCTWQFASLYAAQVGRDLFQFTCYRACLRRLSERSVLKPHRMCTILYSTCLAITATGP